MPSWLAFWHSAVKSMSKKFCTNFTGLSLTGLVVFAATAAPAADASNGERVARRWCASCHLVAPNETGPTSEAPPFASLAAREDFDSAKIARFLLDPHPRMPNMALTRDEAADLAAYIGTLKPRR
jgi:mono/diheme cytochrome c family protein